LKQAQKQSQFHSKKGDRQNIQFANDFREDSTHGNLEVLLIDLDPQGSLTANVGKREVFEDADRLSLDEVLMDVEKWSQIDDVVLTDHEKFDFIPTKHHIQR